MTLPAGNLSSTAIPAKALAPSAPSATTRIAFSIMSPLSMQLLQECLALRLERSLARSTLFAAAEMRFW